MNLIKKVLRINNKNDNSTGSTNNSSSNNNSTSESNTDKIKLFFEFHKCKWKNDKFLFN